MQGQGFRLIPALLVAAGLTLAAPSAARAECATDFVACLTELGGYATSDSLHEMECWGDYLSCIARLIALA